MLIDTSVHGQLILAELESGMHVFAPLQSKKNYRPPIWFAETFLGPISKWNTVGPPASKLAAGALNP